MDVEKSVTEWDVIRRIADVKHNIERNTRNLEKYKQELIALEKKQKEEGWN